MTVSSNNLKISNNPGRSTVAGKGSGGRGKRAAAEKSAGTAASRARAGISYAAALSAPACSEMRHPRRYGAHGSGRRRGGHRIAGGSAGKSCNGQTTKNRRAAAAASTTTTTAGRRRRRRGRDQISDGRPDNLRQLLCSSAKRMTSRFSQVHE